MDTNKNSYTIIYATIMVVIVALMLAFVSGALKDKQTTNVKLDKKKQILTSLNINLAGQDAEALYDKIITGGLVINSKAEVLSNSKEKAFEIDINKELAKPLEKRELPVYIASIDGKTKYIVSLRGAGLWGPIWGYLALNDDKNTVYGAFFSHASETPGLGAEIAQKGFQSEFIGKKIMNSENKFVSIAVVKNGQTAEGMDYVDGISGGTITSKGVDAMLMNCIGQYETFLQQPSITGGVQK
ncbi:MAG TPA: NADH:ubiquinone reductase (Na(+)-transporting) subunit C [Paludibacteraceae bacterium]|nr:NADH:ubiquinone reductase (Na(+)-transporting) subunit C [Paludibacteraceae bacterium]